MKNKQEVVKKPQKNPFVVFGTESPVCGVPLVRKPKVGPIKMAPIKVNTEVQTVYVTKKDDDDDDIFDF